MDCSLEDVVSKVLLDLRVREQVKAYLEEWMFTKDAYKALSMTLLKPEFAGKRFDFKDPKDFEILLITIKSYYPKLTNIDINIIEETIEDYRPVSDRDLPSVFNIVGKFIQKLLLWKGADFIAQNDVKSADYYLTKGHNFSMVAEESVDPTNAEMLRHLRTLDLPEGGLVMKSSLSIVNEKSTYGGYKYGDLIAICAPPKCAKTTFMCQEAAAIADQGFKVAQMWIGDMTVPMGLYKHMANILNEEIKEVSGDNWEHYLELCNKQLKNCRFFAYPALSRTVGEIMTAAKNLKNEFNYDILIIDYDLNIKPAADTMYESGGIIYANLKGFGEANHCAVMIGTQPKPAFWYEEILPGTAPCESSKKSHAIDYLINFGRNSDCKFVGKCHIPYIRHGESEVTTNINYQYSKAIIKEIEQEEYDLIVSRAAAEGQDGLILDEGFKIDPLE